MKLIPEFVKWAATLGREPQTFLSARWVEWLLARAPANRRRSWALRILALSPHYFIDAGAPENRDLQRSAYLEKSFGVFRDSRQKIFDQILKDRLRSNDAVLDYGCGPGFLSHVIAANVRTVYGCDISTGVLACAKILNSAANLTYISADDRGLNLIPDESLDAVVSFAVIQHVSDDIYRRILDNAWRKLRPGGLAIFHVQLESDSWRTEAEWRKDTSVKGRLKYKYGLHCFARSEASHWAMFEAAGFSVSTIDGVAEIASEHFDDICSQHLLTATKAA